MMLLTPAAALAAVLPPDEHIVDGAIQRHPDGRIEVVIGNGERAIDAALCARLQPWIFDLLVLPLPARLIGLRFARRRGDPVAVGALGGTVIAMRELVDPLRAAVARAHLCYGWADSRPLFLGLPFEADGRINLSRIRSVAGQSPPSLIAPELHIPAAWCAPFQRLCLDLLIEPPTPHTFIAARRSGYGL